MIKKLIAVLFALLALTGCLGGSVERWEQTTPKTDIEWAQWEADNRLKNSLGRTVNRALFYEAIDFGAELNETFEGNDGMLYANWSPLMAAIDNDEAFVYLLKKGAKPNVMTQGVPLLVSRMSVEHVNALLPYNLNPSLTTVPNGENAWTRVLPENFVDFQSVIQILPLLLQTKQEYTDANQLNWVLERMLQYPVLPLNLAKQVVEQVELRDSKPKLSELEYAAVTGDVEGLRKL